MSDKAECPACRSYTSEIHRAFDAGKPCPVCARRANEAIRRATAATLRTVAEWGLAFSTTPDEPARDELRDIAEQVDRLDRDEACCPVCQEVTCDEGCPLAPVRAQDDV